MFHAAEIFSFQSALAADFESIRAEYESVAGDFHDWPEKHLYGDGWQVFGLFDFPAGEAIRRNTRRCPVTSALVARHFPGHGAAGFSRLLPGTRIAPHRGYDGSFLRCHLGLVVPDGDCGIEVAGETRRWREGETLVFDDRVLHRAWNLTGYERVVLLVDFPEPPG